MDRISDFACNVRKVLGVIPEQLNRSIPVVVRQRCFSPVTLAQTFILALLQKPTATDSDIATVAASLGIPVSPQAIDQRYNERFALFFQNLFAKIVASRLRGSGTLCALFDRFTEITVADSTFIALPHEMREEFPGRGSKDDAASLKLQTEIELKTGSLKCIEIEPGRDPDCASYKKQKPIKKGSLRIADLGYFSIPVWAHIVACAAHFLSRVQFQTCIEVDGKLQSVIDFLVRLPSSVGVFDDHIRLGRDNLLPCRLMAWRIPKEIAARRRKTLRKIYKRRGKTPSKGALAACDWNMLVTDLPSKKLSLNEAIVLYRSRWQIELLFKRWKSHCQIDLLDGRTLIHTRCRLWIRLCGAVIEQRWVAACGWSGVRPPSFAKLSRFFQQSMSRIAVVLHSPTRLKRLLHSLVTEVIKTCRRNKRIQKPGWDQLIHDPSKLDYALTWC